MPAQSGQTNNTNESFSLDFFFQIQIQKTELNVEVNVTKLFNLKGKNLKLNDSILHLH